MWYSNYPLVKSHNYGTSPFLMGKSMNEMAMFKSKLLDYQNSHCYGSGLIEIIGESRNDMAMFNSSILPAGLPFI